MIRYPLPKPVGSKIIHRHLPQHSRPATRPLPRAGVPRVSGLLLGISSSTGVCRTDPALVTVSLPSVDNYFRAFEKKHV